MTDIILDEKALEAAVTVADNVLMKKHMMNGEITQDEFTAYIVEAAIKAYKANEVDDGWMDIESAPTNGTPLILKDNHGCVYTGEYHLSYGYFAKHTQDGLVEHQYAEYFKYLPKGEIRYD